MMHQIAPERYKGIFDDPPFDRDKSFYVYGSTGTGKTYYAWCVSNYLNREDWRSRSNPLDLPIGFVGWRVVNVPEMVIAYRNLPFPEKNTLVQNWSRGEVIFDDIGAEHLTEFSHELILSILNTRWDRLLWTGFTSNLTIGDLPYGDRIKSRIAGIVGKNTHKLEMKDRRLK